MHSLPKGLLQAICTVESNLDPDAINMNDGGYGNHSLGLCQVGYLTALKLGMKPDRNCKSSSLGRLAKCELMKPEVNIMYASAYLSGQLTRYHDNVNKSISAYNAGSYSRSNQAYVRKVQQILRRIK
jgi:soluble lytic murein transglycosylase-like protein